MDGETLLGTVSEEDAAGNDGWVDPEHFNDSKLMVNQIMPDALKQAGVNLPGMT